LDLPYRPQCRPHPARAGSSSDHSFCRLISSWPSLRRSADRAERVQRPTRPHAPGRLTCGTLRVLARPTPIVRPVAPRALARAIPASTGRSSGDCGIPCCLTSSLWAGRHRPDTAPATGVVSRIEAAAGGTINSGSRRLSRSPSRTPTSRRSGTRRGTGPRRRTTSPHGQHFDAWHLPEGEVARRAEPCQLADLDDYRLPDLRTAQRPRRPDAGRRRGDRGRLTRRPVRAGVG
jgi:hypothetical protein